jgi:acetate kinase
MDSIEQSLKKIPLFQKFTSENIADLLSSSRVKQFAPQELIIRFGQPGRFLGVLLKGRAEAKVTGKTGEKIHLGFLNPGDILGEMSLLTGEPTNADVIALEQSEILLVPQEVFTSSLSTNPHAVTVMAKSLTERLRKRQEDEEEQIRVEEAWQNVEDPYGLSLTSVIPKKILVLNCGSSSLKFAYYDTADPDKNQSGSVKQDLGKTDHEGALTAVFSVLTDPKIGSIKDLREISAVGHRVVHGGGKYSHAVLIENKVIEDISAYSDLAPLHNPSNLMAVELCQKLMPATPQVAVFDTAFHQQMPLHARMYGLPHDLSESEKIRRFGFHGISHHFVALKTAEYLQRGFQELKIITCHLGSGASVCAIDHGFSVDTSTGMTPLEGLVMGTRCGDLDPGILLHLQRDKGISLTELDDILNRRSGLKGLSGISGDFRQVEQAANNGHEKALLAVHIFCYRIRKYIGAYMAALGGLDALVFTGGIGEGSAWVRGLACQGLNHMGICVDSYLNKTAAPVPGKMLEISEEGSRVKIMVIPTDEERMIARETLRTLGYQSLQEVLKKQSERKIPIEVSAHHVHLAKDEIDTLFGPDSQLTVRSPLSQPGQFACEETVDLVGPKGRVDRVRILGPPRKESQVEISMTEEYKLGIKAPIRASGALKGSPGIALEGPEGICRLTQGVICSLRHIHMSPEDALTFGLKDRDIVTVKVKGERTLVFGDVLVRVHPDFRLSMHIDTDEANAAFIRTGMDGTLLGVQNRQAK